MGKNREKTVFLLAIGVRHIVLGLGCNRNILIHRGYDVVFFDYTKYWRRAIFGQIISENIKSKSSFFLFLLATIFS